MVAADELSLLPVVTRLLVLVELLDELEVPSDVVVVGVPEEAVPVLEVVVAVAAVCSPRAVATPSEAATAVPKRALRSRPTRRVRRSLS
ncbi:hypothetical protein D9V37_01470 [Nocardioides mangrovicus]|uniref:Uncharacterized protein n=1 Tax=Nocardioides mangrovicus TaxID=2478913 RepID=A0A3L8P897_9ACTN|nr:hypothetical protein [Nocardioides mangrovicus]RLV50668.1 hypothetical protein D9V37_01470 [Nocardioides mangrovicus]